MLSVKHLSKTFGDVTAVSDISFDINDGEIMGLVGRNGSGKTTIFRMILRFMTSEHPETSITWDGEVSIPAEMIGYLPEERGLYERMTVRQQVRYFANLHGMSSKAVDERLGEWMDRFQVKGKVTDKIKTLSKGNQQKIQLIATLIHEPRIVILDEPFSGLDPVNADLLKNGVNYLRDKGSAIIFSSHNMSNVAELCDTMMMIHDSERVLYGTIPEIRESFGATRLTIQTPNWTKAALEALDGVTQVEAMKNQTFRLVLADESYGPTLYQTLTHGEYIPLFSQQPPTLEEIFKMKAGGDHE
ncbi:MAG: ATP-binding cassette domain-containing protein [Aerococcus sp.]|nr:ATP-binding cassette domain-containing protein [Aerococcus sp.]